MKRFLTRIIMMVLMIPSVVCANSNGTREADTITEVLARTISSNEVEIMWSWNKIVPQSVVVDFETGDLSQGDFENDATYPWEITQDAYESNYAVKSTNSGVDNSEHFLELTVEIPYDGVMSFYHKVESEFNYDGGRFYIDGQRKVSITGIKDWEFVELPVTAGVHTYSWSYVKDFYGDEGEIGSDSYYVDNIVPYEPKAEIPEGWLYYDDGYMDNAIGIGQEGLDNYWAVSFPDMSEYAGKTLTKVAVMIYQGNNVTVSVCLGGTTAPGTVMSTKSFTATPCELVEVELDVPVAIDGTEPLWIVTHCNDGLYPAASSVYCGDPNSSWFMSNNEWHNVAEITYPPVNRTWIIRGYVEDEDGRTVALSHGDFNAVSNATADDKVLSITPERGMIVGTPTRIYSNEYTYNLYKRNVFTGDKPELIEGNLTDTTYIDNTWATYGAGLYQWGVEVATNNIRKANRGDILNVDFEDGQWPEGWLSTTELPYPSLGDWSVRSELSGTTLNPMGLNAAYSKGTGYGLHFCMITSALNLAAETTSTLSFLYANPDWLGDYCKLNVKIGSSQEGPWEAVWTTGTNYTIELTPVTIDLSAYAGQTIYINFENEDSFGHGICVDNIVLSNGGDDPDPNPTEDIIVWSNILEKDMFTTVEVKAELNTDESINGTEVTFVNLNEPEYSYDVRLGNTGTYTWNEFRRGTYEYSVYKRGYESSVVSEIIEILDETSLTCTLTEIVSAATNLYVSPTGWAMWKGEVVSLEGDEFIFDFEDGTTNGWVHIDADGDGLKWANTNEYLAEPLGYESSQCILSASYNNTYGALEPDNYIITAEKYLIGDMSQLTFVVKPMDPDYIEEHYGVAISTKGNTSPDDFDMIWEETISTIDWEFKTVDLSEYSGTEVYVALRHFDCTDNYMVIIDNVALINASKSSRNIESYTVMLNGVEEAIVEELNYRHEDITPGETYTTTVVANFASGNATPVEYTWTAVSCDEYESVSDLKAEHTDGGALLSWSLPEGSLSTEEFKYDNGVNWNFVGITGFDNIKWAVMFPAEELTAGTLSKVSMYDALAHTGDIFVYLGGDTAPQTLVTTQPYECTDIEDFAVFELEEPVAIDGTENLWIVFGNNDMSGSVAPVSDNESSSNARWISVDGVNWLDASSVYATTELSFQIRAYIETGAALGVLVYRDDERITEKIIAANSYLDPITESGTFNYCVEVVYNDYAVSCSQCVEFDYVGVSENNVNAMNVYPNPVKDNLTITAEAMTRITITNTLGQVMLDENVASDSELINMSQYEAGVYVVRITTESGVAVERITVVK